MCEAAGVGVGRSNPCFEVWLILHEAEYDKPDGRHDVKQYYSTLRPEYAEVGAKTPDCMEIVARVEIAESRADQQLVRRENERAPFGCPSTTVGSLTKAIRDAAKASQQSKSIFRAD